MIRNFEKETKKHPTPIIALTAHALKGQQQKCFDVGCTGLLTKPIKKTMLIENLNKLFN